MYLKFITLFLFILNSLSQQYHCNTNTNQHPNQIAKGNSYILCIHFNAQESNQRAVFSLTVDDYTALDVKGVYAKIPKSQDLNLILQPQNSDLTNSTLYYKNSTNKIAKLYSFVLYVNKGKLQRIEDDNSVFCDNNCQSCESYASGDNSFKNCFVEIGDKNDPKILISWMGTDANGQYLLSHTQRISKFTKYSISDVFDAAFNIF